MKELQLRTFLLYSACALMAGLLGYLFLRYAFWWLLPFFIAFIAAALLEPGILFLQKKLHFRRSFSAAVLTLLLLFLFGGTLSLLLWILFAQAKNFLLEIGNGLDMLPQLADRLAKHLAQYGGLPPEWLENWFASNFSFLTLQGSQALSTLSEKFMSSLGNFAAKIPRIALGCITTALAIYFTACAYPQLRTFLRQRLSKSNWQRAVRLKSGFANTLLRWLRAELILCTLTFFQLLAGFFLIGQNFALLLAFLITLVDLLPVFGTGTVLLPWALCLLLLNNTVKAVFLLILYLSTVLVRNVLEPRLMAKQAGLPAIASLAAMYLGFSLLGVSGMILFPFLLLFAAQLLPEERT